MIKYHYYGLNGTQGYGTIAKSDGIPEDVLINIKSVAQQYSETGGFAKNQMHMLSDGGYMVFGNTTEFDAQEGESRKSFFCQQYLLDLLDQGQYLMRLPQLIANLPFITARQPDYPTASQTLPAFEDDFIPPRVELDYLKQLVQAVAEVTLDTERNRQVFICLDDTAGYEQRARGLMAEIAKFLPLESRRRLGFTTYANNIEGQTIWYRVVFCTTDDMAFYKDRYAGKGCYYFHLDSGKAEPAVTVGSYVHHLFALPAQIDRLVFLCDAKLSGELKTKLAAYDALLDLLESCSAEDNLETYLPKRSRILSFLESFYDQKTITRDFIDNIYRKELLLAKRGDIVITDDSLVVWTAFYLKKVLDKEKLIAYMFAVQGEQNDSYITEFVKRHKIKEDFYQYCIGQDVIPRALIDDIASKLRLSSDIMTDIDLMVNRYSLKALATSKVLDSIALYFKEKVDGNPENKQALQMVKQTAQSLNTYPLEPFKKICEAVSDMVDEHLDKIAQQEQMTRKQKQRTKEREDLFAGYSEAFGSPRIESIADSDLFGTANRLQISKKEMDRYAMEFYQEHKLPLALLYAACNFDEFGVITSCDFERTEPAFFDGDEKNDKKALEREYRFLETLTRFKDFDELPVIGQSIAEYLGSRKDLYKLAKKKQKQPYELMLKYGVLNPKNVKLPVLIVSALLVVLLVGAGTVLMLTRGKNDDKNTPSVSSPVSQGNVEDWNASSKFSLAPGAGLESGTSSVSGASHDASGSSAQGGSVSSVSESSAEDANRSTSD
ncbi:hypothetical protein [Candidatus Soleaferrea massiliensis]|uniref:GAP1-M domain-containing protein n=1 Tax=Candidatus Soleaferrea massiliensis TaxID=1470354 RepID=UPI00058F81E8|nr:hypothetical protein [Candidatus Soleaferrea massiliensis]